MFAYLRLRMHVLWVPLVLLWMNVSAAAAATPEAVEQQVLATARGLLQDQTQRAGLAAPLFGLTLVMGRRATPACVQGLVVEGLDTRSPSRMSLAAICPGAEGWRQEFVVRASVSAEVLVAAAEVPAGRPLTAADLSVQRRDVSATPDAMSDLPAASGLSSRRALHPGDILRKSLLAEAMLVHRGDAVRIVARSGPVEVTVAGEALESGGRGSVVRVRNTGNGNIIRARVTAAATVEPAEVDAATPSPP